MNRYALTARCDLDFSCECQDQANREQCHDQTDDHNQRNDPHAADVGRFRCLSLDNWLGRYGDNRIPRGQTSRTGFIRRRENRSAVPTYPLLSLHILALLQAQHDSARVGRGH
jgi:hypothetical protein